MRIPNSTRSSLEQRLRARQRQRWPQLVDIQVRFRASFAYVDGRLPNGEVLPLCRLRYSGSATFWGFAVYLASGDRYEDSVLPTGAFEATPQDAFDSACGLYLNDPSPGHELTPESASPRLVRAPLQIQRIARSARRSRRIGVRTEVRVRRCHSSYSS